MNIYAWIMIVILAAAIIYVDYRIRHKSDAECDAEQRFFDSARLQREIAALYHASQELEQLDQMLIDLRLCKPDELHKAFHISWEGSTGSRSFNFMTTGGNANTAHMIELAEDQREDLNADIQCRIADIYARAQEMQIYAGRREHNGERNDARGNAT